MLAKSLHRYVEAKKEEAIKELALLSEIYVPYADG